MAIRDAAQRARARERVFLVDFQTRTDPLYIEAIGRIRNGDYGEIGLLDALYAGEGFDDPPLTDTIESRLRDLVWVNDIALGGGYFVNAGIHAVDVALWVAGERPLSAVGHSRRARPAPHGDAPDVHSMTFEFPGGLALAYRGEHLRNRHGFSSDCMAYCQRGALTTQYAGHVRIDAHEDAYAGGPVEALYTAGAQRNIDTFHRQVVEGDVSQPTVGPAVDATIATILGRDAAARGTRLTWDEVVKENRRVEPNLSGLRA
jgi:predicted dehydrogenase